MTHSKQNKFAKNSKINTNYVAIALEQDLGPAQITTGLNRLKESKESLRSEKIGLLEDLFVQAITKEK